jgi:hypothetical protein
MALLNLLLLPVLALLHLFETNGPGAGTATAGDPPAEGTPKADAKPADGTKTDKGPAGGVEALRADLATERDRRQQLETELGELRPLRTRLEELEQANQTETEKAITNARKEASSERDAHWQGLIRQARVENALAAAGCTDPGVAALARDFSALKVNDQGDVEKLTETVDAFKQSHPTLFTARVPGGSIDQGAQRPSDQPTTWEDDVAQAYDASGRPRTAAAH